LVSLDLSLDVVRSAESLEPAFRAELLEELAAVGEGMEQAIQFLRSIQDRARGGLARSERFDAAQVARSCVALERPLARKRGIALQGVIAVDGVFLQGDPNALYQVLTNLIRNAVSASRERKTPVVVTLGQVGETLRLAVRDDGGGIAAEHLERIFEPGFTTQAFGSGSGTGLLVVRQITQEMFGGSVRVESTVRRGTTFEVTLPIPPQRTPRERRCGTPARLSGAGVIGTRHARRRRVPGRGPVDDWPCTRAESAMGSGEVCWVQREPIRDAPRVADEPATPASVNLAHLPAPSR